MIVFGTILALLAVVLLIVGGLAAARKLPGNSVVGIRVAEVRKSRRIWDAAHHVAGMFWLVGGVALVFGALVAFRAEGWMWLIPAATVLIALIAVGAGANAGARAAATIDVAEELEKKSQPAAAAPAVDLDALRRAASQADRHEER